MKLETVSRIVPGITVLVGGACWGALFLGIFGAIVGTLLAAAFVRWCPFSPNNL